MIQEDIPADSFLSLFISSADILIKFGASQKSSLIVKSFGEK
jgi:hypothetical protein